MIVAIDRCSDCREILTDEEAATGLLCDQCIDIERCRECSANLADDAGEGYDGMCGSCADVAEAAGLLS